jgi:hypothetical protein
VRKNLRETASVFAGVQITSWVVELNDNRFIDVRKNGKRYLRQAESSAVRFQITH